MRTRQFKALAHGTIVDKIAIYDEDEIQKDLMRRGRTNQDTLQRCLLYC